MTNWADGASSPTAEWPESFRGCGPERKLHGRRRELNVTQGAVSHQVKALEATLGLQLFHRERQRLILTEAGREYLTVIRGALDQIAVATEGLLQRQESGILTVSTSLDVAAKWLVNRLSRFAEKHPEIDLRV